MNFDLLRTVATSHTSSDKAMQHITKHKLLRYKLLQPTNTCFKAANQRNSLPYD
jgi:hypothetical protein